MKLHHWLIIIFIQIVLVAVGLYVYHLYVGQTGIDAGDAITIWATVITIVFIIFSVIGIMNIEGKIKDVEEARQKQEAKYNEVETNSKELIRSIKDAKNQIVQEAEKAIDMGNFYAVPADNRDLNYDKYFKEGDVKRATIEEFNSDNTYRLNLEETKAKIASLTYIQNELNGIPNLV